MSRLEPTPDAIVGPNGEARFGVFDEPFRKLNMQDAAIRSGGIPWPRAWRRARLKEWQHIWLATPELYFGMAGVDAKFVKAGFSYAFERESGRFTEQSVDSPLGKAKMPGELWDDTGFLQIGGFRVDLHSHLDAGRLEFRLDAKATKKAPALAADVVLHYDLARVQPLLVNLELGRNRGMYSHKVVLPAEGEVTVDGRTYTVDPKRDRAIVDVHKAHYPYRTWWKWATCWGWDTEGREIGLNLTRNVALHAETLNECAFWLDGKLHQLAAAEIEHPPGDTTGTWSVGTTDGAARFTFQPEGERFGRVEMGVVSSSFHQPYGTYAGEIDLPTGETVTIREAWGVAEDHRCRW